MPGAARPWPRRSGCTHTPWIRATRRDSDPISALNITRSPLKLAKARPAAIRSAIRAR